MNQNSHTKKLIDEALEVCLRFNWEDAGLDHPDRLASYFARFANRWLKKRGFTVRDRAHTARVHEEMLSFLWARPMLLETHTNLLRSPESFDKTYSLLADDESRSVFDWYVKHRFASAYLHGFANSIFPAPVSKEEFMRMRSNQKEDARQTGFSLFNLAMLGLGQYCLPERGVCAQDGDVVIDAGGGLGDTAWMFRKYVGADGQIFVFEPVASQKKTIELKCQELGWSNVTPVPYGLWDERGNANISVCSGRSTLHTPNVNDVSQSIETITLDQFVEENNVQKIDFIKMDIEGAEQNALIGCRNVIEKYNPKLAISIYHLADDMVRIPEIINEMRTEYRFYLRHYTYFFGDTVLYAEPVLG